MSVTERSGLRPSSGTGKPGRIECRAGCQSRTIEFARCGAVVHPSSPVACLQEKRIAADMPADGAVVHRWLIVAVPILAVLLIGAVARRRDLPPRMRGLRLWLAHLNQPSRLQCIGATWTDFPHMPAPECPPCAVSVREARPEGSNKPPRSVTTLRNRA
jgi:hypothetical protein